MNIRVPLCDCFKMKLNICLYENLYIDQAIFTMDHKDNKQHKVNLFNTRFLPLDYELPNVFKFITYGKLKIYNLN